MSVQPPRYELSKVWSRPKLLDEYNKVNESFLKNGMAIFSYWCDWNFWYNCMFNSLMFFIVSAFITVHLFHIFTSLFRQNSFEYLSSLYSWFPWLFLKMLFFYSIILFYRTYFFHLKISDRPIGPSIEHGFGVVIESLVLSFLMQNICENYLLWYNSKLNWNIIKNVNEEFVSTVFRCTFTIFVWIFIIFPYIIRRNFIEFPIISRRRWAYSVQNLRENLIVNIFMTTCYVIVVFFVVTILDKLNWLHPSVRLLTYIDVLNGNYQRYVISPYEYYLSWTSLWIICKNLFICMFIVNWLWMLSESARQRALTEIPNFCSSDRPLVQGIKEINYRYMALTQAYPHDHTQFRLQEYYYHMCLYDLLQSVQASSYERSLIYTNDKLWSLLHCTLLAELTSFASGLFEHQLKFTNIDILKAIKLSSAIDQMFEPYQRVMWSAQILMILALKGYHEDRKGVVRQQLQAILSVYFDILGLLDAFSKGNSYNFYKDWTSQFIQLIAPFINKNQKAGTYQRNSHIIWKKEYFEIYRCIESCVCMIVGKFGGDLRKLQLKDDNHEALEFYLGNVRAF